MHLSSFVTVLPLVALSVTAAPLDNVLTPRAVSSTCPSYVIINTRGTGEAQGESSGFRTMNSRITSQLEGGTIYNTVYPASFSQNSAAGTEDIIDRINTGLQSNPSECFILQGYSQGAAATVDALPELTGEAFDAVKGVFLIGNPDHKAGLACNVDNNGGTTTANVNGLSGRFSPGIPSEWVSKTLDVCIRVSLSKYHFWPLLVTDTSFRAMVSAILRMALASTPRICATPWTVPPKT